MFDSSPDDVKMVFKIAPLLGAQHNRFFSRNEKSKHSSLRISPEVRCQDRIAY